MDKNDMKYMLWLSYLYDVSFSNIEALLNIFGRGENIYRASEREIIAFKRFPHSFVERLMSLKRKVSPDKLLEDMLSKGINFISIYDDEYPPLLKAIANPPLGLYILGKMPDFEKLWINIVGTRRPTTYGKTMAERIGKDLAGKTAVIVSGMADGLDSVSHRAALDNKGETLAVLGCGVDICYPKGNMELYRRLIENGCIISEFPIGTEPKSWHFPMRNRIMSGISHATVVIEARIKSGTMITADFALEQGREVFAVPGNVTSPTSSGTNLLIKEGAHVATCAADVLDALGFIESACEDAYNEEIQKNNDIPLAPNEKRVYALLGNEPKELEYIVMESGLDYRSATLALTNLELGSRIKKLPGQRYML